MRKIATVLLAVTTIAVAYYFMDLTPDNKNDEQTEFTKKYEQWLLDRYKDPVTGKIPDNIRHLELQFAQEMKKNDPRFKKYGSVQSLNEWTSRGPYFIGGRTRALAFDINDENRILAGGVDAGVILSTDGGKTWSKKTKNNQLPSITTIDQDKRPGKQHIWYHGTGERLGSRSLGNGVYKSTDNGESWFQLPSTTERSSGTWDNAFDFVYRIRTNPNAPENRDEVYAALALGGIYRSIDGGTTWSPVIGNGISNNSSFYSDIEVTSTGIFYAALSSNGGNNFPSTVKGIYRSIDGRTWTNITPDNFPERYNRIAIGIDPQNENKVYFVGETPGYGTMTTNSQQDSMWHSLYRYEYKAGNGKAENGVWTDLSHNIPNPELVRHQMNSQRGYDLHIKVHPKDSNIVYIGAVNLYRSKSAWQENDFVVIGGTCPTEDCEYFYRYPNHHADQHNLVFLPSNPDIMYTATDGGIHKTLDNRGPNTEWISLNEGYNTTQLYSVGIDHATENADLIGGFQDNGTNYSISYDTKSHWSEVLRADGFSCGIADSSKFIITSQNSSYPPGIKYYKSELDENGKIQKYARIDPIGGEDFIWNTPFVLDPNNNNIMYVAGGRSVWRNNDLSKVEMTQFPANGWSGFKTLDSISTEWDELIKTKVDLGDTTDERITAIQVSKNPANVLYYGTNLGNLYRIDNSNTGDNEPVLIRSKEFSDGSYVSSISIDPDDASNVIMCFSNYNVRSIFHTTNSGETWIQVGGNLEVNEFGTGSSPAVNDVKIINYNGKKAYLAGTTIGLYMTTELNGMGTVWQQEAENTIGYNNVFTIDTRSLDGYTVAGTYATGTYGTFFRNFPSAPGKVALSFPANNSEYISDQAEFKWNKVNDAYYYNIEIATDSEFKNIIYQKNNVDSNITKVEGLERGFKTYYWRVAPISSGGKGEYSEIWKFQTGMSVPKLIYPEQSAKDIPTNASLNWEKFSVDGIKYKVQLSNNGFFNNILFEDITTEDNISFDLEGNKKYFWRVMAFNDFDSSGYDEKFNFTTEPKSNVNISQLEKNIALYPNPASNYVKIDLSKLGNIPKSIKLIDSKGKVLKSYDYKIKSSQLNYDFEINGLPSGQYIIRLQFEKFTISKRFVKL